MESNPESVELKLYWSFIEAFHALKLCFVIFVAKDVSSRA